MRFFFFFFFLHLCCDSLSQNINLNESFIERTFRDLELINKLDTNNSFTIRPINLSNYSINDESYLKYKDIFTDVIKSKNGKTKLSLLPVDYILDYNSHHPYNRNNGTLIPNRGYQHLLSLGIFAKIGPLEIQIKPEHHFAQNLEFDGFWEGHYDEIWAKRYVGWNRSDIPERFGEKRINQNLIGQTSIKLKFRNLSFGISNENIWWGPSIRNSIMLSNHSRSFKHISFETHKPIETRTGSFEWQFVTGRLELSGYPPPGFDREFMGRVLWKPEHNQARQGPDWRYFQGLIITYNPKWLKNFYLGTIRWAQLYGGFLEGEYNWFDERPGYFPLFSSLFKTAPELANVNQQIDEAGGVFFRWLMKKSSTEIYSEFYFNDAKVNLRDLLLDSDHSRAVTLGFRKGFNNNQFIFSWEWTQMEQTSSRLIRTAGSWYYHFMINSGYTNYGEVMGSAIGPGSNSQYFEILKQTSRYRALIGFEIVDNDNDFFYYAFESAKDFRRYWKDLNFNIGFEKKFKNIWFSTKLLYQRSLNYQWQLDDNIEPYYHPGKDVNNFHANFKILYTFPRLKN